MPDSTENLKTRKRRWPYWLGGIVGLISVAWVVLNNLLPVWNPMLVVRKIDLPGARVRAVAALMEENRGRIGTLFGPPTGEHAFHSPWMRRTDEWKNEHYILPVQWVFRSFLRSGSVWEKRAVLGAASMRGCAECFAELMALQDEEELVWRIKIARALGHMASAEALTEVEKLTAAPEPEMRIASLKALYSPSQNPALRARTLRAARRLLNEDPAEPVRRMAADFLLWQRVYCAPDPPAVPYDPETTALFRNSFPRVRQGIAESLCAAAWHRRLQTEWLPEVEIAWHDEALLQIKANLALVLIMERNALAPEAIAYLENLCPPALRPLTEEKLRTALGKHLPYGLCYQYIERSWKR